MSNNTASTEEEILLTDRTTIETDWKCGMALWWYKYAADGGVVPAIEPDYFSIGKDIHDGFADLTLGKPLSAVLESFPPPTDQVGLERWSRLVGWLSAYYLYELPRLHERYEVVAVEKEIVWEQPPVWVGVTPDLILRDKEDKKCVYREYKTFGRGGPGWALHWRYAVQVHLGLEAAEKEYGERMKFGQVMGLWKGRPYKGKLFHPYIWVYKHPTDEQYSSLSKNGWEPFPAWEYLLSNPNRELAESALLWVAMMGEQAKLEVFHWSEPIFYDPLMVEGLGVRQQVRQKELKEYAGPARTNRVIRLQHFEQRFTECKPVVGDACPYIAACFNKTVGEDPVGSGLYIKRTPHHELELISRGESEEE